MDSLYLDADPDQREKQISAFQSSHDEWQEYKRILDLHETKGVPFSDDDVKQLLGEEYHDNTKDDGKSLTIESIAHLIFRPGMKYVGTICIPSLGNIYDDDSDEEDEIDAHVSRNAASSDNAATISNNQSVPSDRTTTSSNNSGEKTYELVILERGDDEFGNGFILGAHHAYDDTQCVYININIRDSDGQTSEQVLGIEYEDEETCIKGILNTSSCRLEGCVRQRLQANDGAFHTSDEVTHVFTLYPCTNECPSGRGLGNEPLQSSFQEDLTSAKTRAFVELRNRAYSKGRECAYNYNDIFKSDGLKIELDDLQVLKSKTSLSSADSAQVRSVWKLRESNWEDLSTLYSMLSENTCARFRYRASLLDGASFESGEQQKVFFEKWKRAGFCLDKAHAEWDSCSVGNAQVAQIVYVLSRSLGSLTFTLNIMMHKSRRLYQNYDNLESSWRRATARPPTDFFKQFEVSSHELSEQFTCSICFDGVSNEDNEGSTIALYRLPCSHCFHVACLQKWFHNHVTCPICRSPATVADEDTK